MHKPGMYVALFEFQERSMSCIFKCICRVKEGNVEGILNAVTVALVEMHLQM